MNGEKIGEDKYKVSEHKYTIKDKKIIDTVIEEYELNEEEGTYGIGRKPQ